MDTVLLRSMVVVFILFHFICKWKPIFGPIVIWMKWSIVIFFGWNLIAELRERTVSSLLLSLHEMKSETAQSKHKKISYKVIEKKEDFQWISFLLNRPIAICDSVTCFLSIDKSPRQKHTKNCKWRWGLHENNKWVDEKKNNARGLQAQKKKNRHTYNSKQQQQQKKKHKIQQYAHERDSK